MFGFNIVRMRGASHAKRPLCIAYTRIISPEINLYDEKLDPVLIYLLCDLNSLKYFHESMFVDLAKCFRCNCKNCIKKTKPQDCLQAAFVDGKYLSMECHGVQRLQLCTSTDHSHIAEVTTDQFTICWTKYDPTLYELLHYIANITHNRSLLHFLENVSKHSHCPEFRPPITQFIATKWKSIINPVVTTWWNATILGNEMYFYAFFDLLPNTEKLKLHSEIQKSEFNHLAKYTDKMAKDDVDYQHILSRKTVNLLCNIDSLSIYTLHAMYQHRRKQGISSKWFLPNYKYICHSYTDVMEILYSLFRIDFIYKYRNDTARINIVNVLYVVNPVFIPTLIIYATLLAFPGEYNNPYLAMRLAKRAKKIINNLKYKSQKLTESIDHLIAVAKESMTKLKCNECKYPNGLRKSKRKKKLRPCTGCCQFFYCSKRCQKRNWNKQHRNECTKNWLATIEIIRKAKVRFMPSIIEKIYVC